VDLPNPAATERRGVLAASTAELAVEAVQRDRVELGESQLAEGRLNLSPPFSNGNGAGLIMRKAL